MGQVDNTIETRRVTAAWSEKIAMATLVAPLPQTTFVTAYRAVTAYTPGMSGRTRPTPLMCTHPVVNWE
jgi:hypothetical protein